MEESKKLLKRLMSSYDVRYITFETKFVIHHIEKLMPTARDRGRWKWIAEMKPAYWDALTEKQSKEDYEEAQRSHIDDKDLFPRFMFLTESLINELFAWCEVRQTPITEIKTPKI